MDAITLTIRRIERVRDFAKWGFDIIPHRVVMKTGFETPDGKRVNVEDALKNDQHPFRVAIVCAMWLTGFDVECLRRSTPTSTASLCPVIGCKNANEDEAVALAVDQIRRCNVETPGFRVFQQSLKATAGQGGFSYGVSWNKTPIMAL